MQTLTNNFPRGLEVVVTKHAWKQCRDRFPGLFPDREIDDALRKIARRGKRWNNTEVRADGQVISARTNGQVVVYLRATLNADGTLPDRVYVTTVGDTSRRDA